MGIHKDPMRVVGYVRRRPDQPLGDLLEHETRIQAFCTARGYELVQTYADTADGDSMIRPGLVKLLDDTALDGDPPVHAAIDAVITTSVAQLTTQICDLWHLLVGEFSSERHICLITVDGVIDGDTAAGLVVMQALLGVGE